MSASMGPDIRLNSAVAFPVPIVQLYADWRNGPRDWETRISLVEPNVTIAVEDDFIRKQPGSVPLMREVGLHTVVTEVTTTRRVSDKPTMVSYSEHFELGTLDVLLTDHTLQPPHGSEVFDAAAQRVADVPKRLVPQTITILGSSAFTAFQNVLYARCHGASAANEHAFEEAPSNEGDVVIPELGATDVERLMLRNMNKARAVLTGIVQALFWKE